MVWDVLAGTYDDDDGCLNLKNKVIDILIKVGGINQLTILHNSLIVLFVLDVHREAFSRYERVTAYLLPKNVGLSTFRNVDVKLVIN